MNEQYMSAKCLDDYEACFYEQTDLLNEVRDMENNSEWIEGVASSDIRLDSLFPMEVFDKASMYGIDETIAMETAQSGTKLIVTDGSRVLPIRDCARTALMETAKLQGSALTRMNPTVYAECLNYGFSVARGSSILLVRYGKVSSCHSDAEGNGYAVMPISELLESTIETAESLFGQLDFKAGYNSHSYTQAVWELPDSKRELSELYQSALEAVNCTPRRQSEIMPCLRFGSSDTSGSCATLIPLFRAGDRYVRLSDGVRIRHTRGRNGEYGMELYRKEIRDIYAKFTDSAEIMKDLAATDIYNAENCVVSLCRKFNIPKKYGEAAREEVSRYSGILSAFDIYLAMSIIPADAEAKRAPQYIVSNLDETVARIARIQDWDEYDVGGMVSWKD